MELETDKTELFLTSSGKLAYPSSESKATIKGLRAYFKVPAGADARLNIDGIDTSLELVNDDQCSLFNIQYYDLQGRKVSNPAKGIYISNHKKVVIK